MITIVNINDIKKNKSDIVNEKKGLHIVCAIDNIPR